MQQTPTSTTTPRTAPAKAASEGFRPDIQGLRAVAVGVVLLFHANAPFLPGGFIGVDVFFVISGYLITGLLLREAVNNGRIDFADFWAKRARRILPAATVVLIATLILTALFLPPIRWQQIGVEAAGAAVYIVNWIFAGGTDYLNAEIAASPLQHFWTLSVEEQFYIVWPLLLAFAIWLAARSMKRSASIEDQRKRTIRWAGWAILLILVPSLLWSVYYTAVHPAPAYFVTTTRLWELAVGAALAAFAAQAARMPAWLGYALGWAGLAGILVASVFYTSTSPAFPSAAALLPTLSAAAVIAGGMGGRATTGVGRLLGLRPMRWVGDISYSLYLWHWPLIVVGTYLLGGELRFRWGLVIVLLAFVPSWLSYRYIENPFRNWPRLKASAKRSLWAGGALIASTAVAASAIVVAPALTGQGGIGSTVTPNVDGLFDDALAGTADPEAPATGGQSGAEGSPSGLSEELLAKLRKLGEPVDSVPGGITPSPLDARRDNAVIYDEGCHLQVEEWKPKECVFGNPESPDTVVLVGDSHAASMYPAIGALAEQHDWRLLVSTKSACSFADVTQPKSGGPYTMCSQWNEAMTDIIEQEKPDLVVTINSARRSVFRDGASLKGDARIEAFAGGLERTWQNLEDRGIPVIAIRDTPEMGIDVPECVSANLNELTRCAVPKSEAIAESPRSEDIAADAVGSVQLVDLDDWICPSAEVCPAVVGNVLVWRDNQHLTATYAHALTEPLGAMLNAQAPSEVRHLFV